MGHRFADIAFTPRVRAIQEAEGSRKSYARFDGGPDHHGQLGATEAQFIAARDSFYMATVSETGWPYIQHRGGPVGFVRVLGDNQLGVADFRGNRQYVSVGNLGHDDRVSLFFMDYPNQRRLKVLGRARIVTRDDEPAMMDALRPSNTRATVERGFVIRVAAFDWNCPQHITQRFTGAEIAEATAPLHARIAELKAQLAALRG
jgi:uncharacterized protein